MNLPNRLSAARILLALILIVVLPYPGIAAKAVAFVIFLIASLTDYLDGRIARARGLVTALGRLLDPVADKLLTFSAFCGFLVLDLIPAWMVLAIVLRDLLITGFRLMMPPNSKRVEARSSGKHKTAIQFIAISSTLIYLICRELPFWRVEWTPVSLKAVHGIMWLVVIITLYSGLRYLYANRDFFKGSAFHPEVRSLETEKDQK